MVGTTHLTTIFLRCSKVGTAHGLRLSWIKPFDSNSSTCLLSSLCSNGFIRYAGRLGSCDPGTKSTACWMLRIGGKSLGNSFGATSKISDSNLDTFRSVSWGVVGAGLLVSLAITANTTPLLPLSLSKFFLVRTHKCVLWASAIIPSLF